VVELLSELVLEGLPLHAHRLFAELHALDHSGHRFLAIARSRVAGFDRPGGFAPIYRIARRRKPEGALTGPKWGASVEGMRCSLTMPAALAAVAAVAGCGSSADLQPCVDRGGSCLEVHLGRSGAITAIDQRELRL